MHKTFIQVHRGSIHIQLEIRWKPELVEPLDAYIRFRSMPLIAQQQGKHERVETTRDYIECFIEDILRKKGFTLTGTVFVANVSLTEQHHLHCAFELSQHPSEAVLAGHGAIRRESIAPWPLPQTACAVPREIMLHAVEPEDRDHVQPGSGAWVDAAHNLLMHALARAVSAQQGIAISIDDPSFGAHLQKLADAAGLSVSELRATCQKDNLLQGVAEHLLIETVLARLGNVQLR